MIIDTHTHLYAPEFDADRSDMVARARHAGVGLMLLPAIDSGSFKAMWDTVNQFSEVMKPMIGLHPCSVKAETLSSELLLVEDELQNNREQYVAIGEIGIDLYWDKTTLPLQTEAFRQQLQWAKAHHLPVAIHSRNSFDEVLNVLQEEQDGNLTGVLHCFTGGKRHVNRARDLGFYFGIGGVVTYQGSGLDHVLKRIGLNEIVLETDAPYLSPIPVKDQRNEPAFLPYIAQEIALIKDVSVEEVVSQTTQNAHKLFKL
jgi:TatD DNase family protein